MPGFKDLPKSLIDAVSSILEAEEKCAGCDNVVDSCECTVEETDRYDQDGNKEEVKEDDMPGDAPFHKDGDEQGEKKKEIDEEDTEEKEKEQQESLRIRKANMFFAENIAIVPDELASANGVLGQTELDIPKHVDIVKEDDFRPLAANGTRTEGYRLLCQYSTNRRPEYIPSLDLPAAPTLEALTALIPGSPEVVQAIINAANLPSQQPRFRGNDKE